MWIDLEATTYYVGETLQPSLESVLQIVHASIWPKYIFRQTIAQENPGSQLKIKCVNNFA